LGGRYFVASQRPEPEVRYILDVLLKHSRLTTKEIAEQIGFSYDDTRRVLERYGRKSSELAIRPVGEIYFRKVMLGKRRIAWEWIDLGLGEREDDYPDGWLEPGTFVDEDFNPIPPGVLVADAEKITVEPAEDDPRIFVLRLGGRTLGEVAELRLGDRVCYQLANPWEPKSFDTLGEAFEYLKKKVDRTDSR
jgi:hypothetical protein